MYGVDRRKESILNDTKKQHKFMFTNEMDKVAAIFSKYLRKVCLHDTRASCGTLYSLLSEIISDCRRTASNYYIQIFQKFL